LDGPQLQKNLSTTRRKKMSTKKKTPSTTLNKMDGVYDGAELKRWEGRPNSMDAYDKPSIVNGERIKHRPMVGMTSNARTPYNHA
jgi:hypothetical protein